MKLSKIVLITLFVLLGMTAYTGQKKVAWGLIAKGKGGAYKLNSIEKNNFSLTIEKNNISSRAGVQVCKTIDREQSTSEKLIITCENKGNIPVEFQVLISHKKDGKSIMRYGPKLTLSPKKLKTYIFSLKSFLKKEGANVHFWQLKISVNINKAASGSKTTINFKNIAILPEEKINLPVNTTSNILRFPAKTSSRSSKKKINDWSLIVQKKGGNYRISSVSPEEFCIYLEKNDVKAAASTLAYMTVDRSMHSQNKLIFMCRAINDNPVVMQVNLSYKKGRKSVLKFGRKFVVKGMNFKKYSLALDSYFKLEDAQFHIWQIKISASISGAAPGTKAGVELKNIRLVAPEEASFSSRKGAVVIYPRPTPAVQQSPNAVKIYFHFDNEDYGTFFGGRGKNPKVHDNCQYPGFREMLLSTVKNQTVIVDKAADADVIVYSAARRFPKKAREIADAVKNGTPLFAAGLIADPEIVSLLPAQIKKIDRNDFPTRMMLKPEEPDNKLFDGINPAKFAVYLSIKALAGSKTLLSFSDGTPAVLEGRSGKGQVLYSALGIGLDLIKNKKAHDPFLLRVISKLTGKKLKEYDQKHILPQDGFYIGASQNNFGRFGFMLGDGLLTETINNELTVINGAQEYSFSTQLNPKISLVNWHIKAFDKNMWQNDKAISYKYKWNQIGKFELNSQCVIPGEWNKKSVFFVVQEGIDDTSEVYINGVLIGKVTADMHHYWCRPQHYLIPSKLIRFGENNHIRIISENLRGSGGFGSCPEFIALAGKGEERRFVADRINYLGKGGVISEGNIAALRFDTSLAFPGIRWEIFSDSVDMALSNIADYAALPTSKGIVIVDMKMEKELLVDLVEPWILFFRKGIEHPLLLVMEKRLDKLLIKHTGDVVAGITLKHRGGVGTLIPVWLYGRAPINSKSWNKGLPKDIVDKISFWYPKAFSYPISAVEKFSLDEKSKRINIRTKYTYKTAKPDWPVPQQKFAPVSPLAYLTKGMLFKGKDVRDWQLVTSYGNYAACEDSDTVEWSLPLPSPNLSLIPALDAYRDIYNKANKVFANGILWSAGGRVKCTDWTPAYPQGTQYPKCLNINMHGWLHGIQQAITAPFGLTKENFIKLKERIKLRLFEAIELYQYKSAQRWREEPLSGIRYPIYFNNRHVHGSKYAKGFGSSMNYGDQNETAQMILYVLQNLADKHGQRDLILTNVKFIHHVAQLLLSSDDWAYLSSHCRESGLSATIDMLNSEYSSMMKLARLAEISGDKALRAQALYRAARRMVPTLARFLFKDYAIKNKLVAYPDNISICVGFNEEGGSYRTKGFIPKGIDLYDMSQGIPPDIVSLYRQYLGSRQNIYFDKIVFPKMFNKNGQYRLRSSMLNITAQSSNVTSDILKKAMYSYLSQDKKLKKLGRDWPGMTLVTDISQVIYRIAGKVRVHTAKDLEIKTFVFDPKTKTLKMDFIAGIEAELILKSSLEPVNSRFKRDDTSLIRIPVNKNKQQQLVIKFR